ncbi:hypothetical protein CEXT_448661, partial [Caerostris extrusa]
KIELDEIAPGTHLPGPSSSSSSACINFTNPSQLRPLPEYNMG